MSSACTSPHALRISSADGSGCASAMAAASAAMRSLAWPSSAASSSLYGFFFLVGSGAPGTGKWLASDSSILTTSSRSSFSAASSAATW